MFGMSTNIKPLLSRFEVEVLSVGPSKQWDPGLELIAADHLRHSKLVSREVTSINSSGATTVTRVRNETVDDD